MKDESGRSDKTRSGVWLLNDVRGLGLFLTSNLFALIPFLSLLLLTNLLLHWLAGNAGAPEGSSLQRAGPLAVVSLLAAAAGVGFLRVNRLIRSVSGTEERYRLVVEQAAEGILILDENGEFEVNFAACQMVRCDGRCPGRRNCPFFRDMAAKAEPACASTSESPITRSDGSVILVEATVSKLQDGRRIAILRDVTSRKRAEEALQQSERRHRLLFERSMVGLFRIGPDGVCTDCNDSFARTLGYVFPDELLGLEVETVVLDRCYPRPDLRHLRQEGDFLSMEVQLDRRSGGQGWALLNLVVAGLKEGAPGGLAGTLVDLTASKEAERGLRALLAEKEELLREVHHRVKNNLQIIDSLLSFECGSDVDQRVRERFQRARDRVNSIALVHRMIYCTRDVAQVNLQEYVEQLISHLRSCYCEQAENVRFELRVEIGGVDLDAAIPCGLIINELVSNALKHAFPAGRKGVVRLELSESGECRELTVSDDGVGLPHGFCVEQSESFGLQLVYSLAAQLGGSVEAEHEYGATFRITFRKHRSMAREAA